MYITVNGTLYPVIKEQLHAVEPIGTQAMKVIYWHCTERS